MTAPKVEAVCELYQPVFLSVLFLHTSTDCARSFQCLSHRHWLKSVAKESSTDVEEADTGKKTRRR